MTVETDEKNPLEGEDGWEPVGGFNERHAVESFVSGEPHGQRLRVRYFRRTSDDALMVRVWFGPGTQGPPGHVHGGAQAALLDETMGFAAWLAGYQVVAAHIEVDFRSMVPLGAVATVEAKVTRVRGRKIQVRARLDLGDGTVAAESSGLFIQLSPEHLEKLGGLAEKARMNPDAFA